MIPLKYFAFGAFFMASIMVVIVIPAVAFGTCTLRLSSPCTTEEALAHIEILRQIVLKDAGK